MQGKDSSKLQTPYKTHNTAYHSFNAFCIVLWVTLYFLCMRHVLVLHTQVEMFLLCAAATLILGVILIQCDKMQ